MSQERHVCDPFEVSTAMAASNLDHYLDALLTGAEASGPGGSAAMKNLASLASALATKIAFIERWLRKQGQIELAYLVELSLQGRTDEEIISSIEKMRVESN